MTLPRWIAPGAVVFVVLWLALMVIGRSGMFRDPGTFWHITTGEIILKEGFIRYDPYTFSFAGSWWVPFQWLGEVGMALAHRVSGFDTELLAAVTILAGTFAFLTVRLLRTGLHPIVVAAVMGLGMAAAGSHFHVRPHVVTMAALAITVALLTDFDMRKGTLRRLFWLIPLFVFWVNVHGGVIGGFATVAIAAGGWVVFWLFGWPSPVNSWREALAVVLLAIACVLTALVNPYGIDMLRVWHKIMDEPILREIIQEHRPLDPTAEYAWPLFGLAAVYAVLLAGVNWREIRVTWLLPAVWFVLSVERCRHAPLFAIAALVSFAAIWPHTRWAKRLVQSRPDFYQPEAATIERPWWANVWLPAMVVCLSLGLQAAGIRVPVIGAGWTYHSPKRWPVELLDAIKANEPVPGQPNQIFNDYIDGGFIIYYAPGYKVFVDDRCEVFGGRWLKDFVIVGHPDTTPPERSAAFEKWEKDYGRFSFALTRAGTCFDDYFKSAPGWECVKRCELCAFYRRKQLQIH